MNRKFRIKDYLPVVIMLCAAVGVLILTSTGKIDIKRIPEIAQDNKGVAVIIIMGLFALKGVSGVIVYDALVLAIAMIFPTWETIVLTLIGTIITLSISYFMGTAINTEQLKAKIEENPKLSRYYWMAEKYGAAANAILHLMALSMELLGMLFGALKLGYIKYLLSALLGMLPNIFSFIFIGKNPDIHSPSLWIMIAVYAGFIVAAFLYAKRLAKKNRQEQDRYD